MALPCLALAQTSPSVTSNTTISNSTEAHSTTSGTGLVVLWAALGVLGAFGLGVLLLFLARRLREKRRTEGSYRPSKEEQEGARAPPPAPLRLPPEERLI